MDKYDELNNLDKKIELAKICYIDRKNDLDELDKRRSFGVIGCQDAYYDVKNNVDYWKTKIKELEDKRDQMLSE